MKRIVTIIRIIVGILFIFSGLVKALDPLGLAYKMQEFFEAWSGAGFFPIIMNKLHEYALLFAMLLNALEVLSGVALLVGWKRKITLRVLMVLTVLFTFLTGYALFTGTVRECGCFGDCIPLSAIGTFVKDIVLLVLIIILMIGKKYIEPVSKGLFPVSSLLFTIVVIVFIQSNALEHLPLIDCLPYKKGNNLLELRKMPADATFDEYSYTFIYQKGGEQKEFTADNVPDSTWTFVEQKKKLIKKGNGKMPLINDFSLTDSLGSDVTDKVLGQNDEYYLFFIKGLNGGTSSWANGFKMLWQKAKEQHRNVYVVTPEKDTVNDFLNVENHYNVPILVSDATAVKTAARCNPTIFLMNGPVVQGKWSWADIDEAIKN